MTEQRDSAVHVDPAFARVQPRWGSQRTERNLAATFARLDGARRGRRLGVLSFAVAGLAALALVVSARTPRPEAVVARGTDPALVQPVVAIAPVVVPAPVKVAAPAPVVEMARVDFKIASARARFRMQVARREYAAAYRSLVAVPGVADHSAEGLMLAADAARLSGHAAESVPYFRRLLREHAGDARAPVAAFTLGRILLSELERPAEAAEAFATARRLAPSGPLAPDALAREVEATARAGDPGRARSLAAEYLARYPSGSRAAAVRRAGGLE